MVFLLYCTPSCLPVGRDPALQGGDCRILSVQIINFNLFISSCQRQHKSESMVDLFEEPFYVYRLNLDKWSPRAKPVVPPLKYPPTPLGVEALRGAGAKASEGYPPVAKSTEASSFEHMNNIAASYAFIHGQCPWSPA
jgi:hypothetical protein